MYQVYNDNNIINVDYLGSLIDTISNSKKFSLSRSDIDYMIKILGDRIIIDIDIRNQSGYLIFNVHV